MNEIKHDNYNTPDIYTNSINVSASIYEVTLEFNLTTPTKDETETRELVRVRMSPQQAEALRILLDKYLKVYSEQFQEIILPDELVNRLSGIEKRRTDEHQDIIKTDEES